jgi:DNA-binding LacI/PurR family transcriptional regulator
MTPNLALNQAWQLTERVAGFRDALKMEGGAIRETTLVEGSVRLKAPLFKWKKGGSGLAGQVILYTPSEELADGCERGLVAMRQLLKTRGDTDAVLCANDDWAMGALATCGEAGVRVPQELAITGFDDMLYARYGAVPLTTMAQPLERMTQHAVGLLVRMIRGAKPAASEMSVKMPCRLMVRRSCGAGQA